MPEKRLGLRPDPDEVKQMGFWAIHVDTLGWSVLMGLVFLFLFSRVAKRANAERPRACRISWKCASSSSRAWSRTPSTAAIR